MAEIRRVIQFRDSSRFRPIEPEGSRVQASSHQHDLLDAAVPRRVLQAFIKEARAQRD